MAVLMVFFVKYYGKLEGSTPLETESILPMKLLRKISINFQSTFSSASLSWLLKLPNIQYLRHYVAQSNNR